VSDLDDHDHKNIVVNRVDYAIVVLANPIQLFSRELLRFGGRATWGGTKPNLLRCKYY